MEMGVSGKWGDECGSSMTFRVVAGWGLRMSWVVRLVETRPDGPERSLDVLEFGQLPDLGDIADWV